VLAQIFLYDIYNNNINPLLAYILPCSYSTSKRRL